MWTTLENLYSRIEDNEIGQTLFEEFWREHFLKYKSIEEYGAKLKSYHDLRTTIDQSAIATSAVSSVKLQSTE